MRAVASTLGLLGACALLAGCGDSDEVMMSIRMLVPGGDGSQVPEQIEYALLCTPPDSRRINQDEVTARGFMKPPSKTAEEVERFTWTADVPLPPGTCIFRTRSVRLHCNGCSVSEMFDVERHAGRPVQFVLLCTLSFCTLGDVLLTADVDAELPPNTPLDYNINCDGTDEDATPMSEGRVDESPTSTLWTIGSRWEHVVGNLPTGRCTLDVSATSETGGMRCTASREFEARAGWTANVHLDLACEPLTP